MFTDRRAITAVERSSGREPWPIALALGLLLMIGGSLAFLRIAITHPDPVIAGDAFAASRAHERATQARMSAEARGWQLVTEATPSAEGVHVRVQMRDADGRVLIVEQAIVQREHPSEGGLDAAFATEIDGEARVANIPLPRAGRWRVWVTAEREGETLIERLDVTGGGR